MPVFSAACTLGRPCLGGPANAQLCTLFCIQASEGFLGGGSPCGKQGSLVVFRCTLLIPRLGGSWDASEKKEHLKGWSFKFPAN